MPVLRLCLPLAVAAFAVTACQAPYAMHLPDAPVAREIHPDHDAYRHFRAEAGPKAGPADAVTLCAIDDVGSLPTFT